MSVSSPTKAYNPSNSSNSSNNSALPPSPVTRRIDINSIPDAQTTSVSRQEGTPPPRMSTPRNNAEFIQFIAQQGWKATTKADNDAGNDTDNEGFSPLGQALIMAASDEAGLDEGTQQRMLDELSVCFEKFFWRPDLKHLDALNQKIEAIKRHQGQLPDADASALVNRVLSATGLFAPTQLSPRIKTDRIRHICTSLLEALAKSGAVLFQPNPRRAAYLLESAVRNGLTDAFVMLVQAAQFEDSFIDNGEAIFSRAMRNDIPFDLALSLCELNYHLSDEEAATNILLICLRILDHWAAHHQDKGMHEELLGSELQQTTHPLITAESVEALLEQAGELGLTLSQDAFLGLISELMRCCIDEPDQSRHAEKLEVVISYSGLKASVIRIDELPLLHWAILNGSQQLAECLLRTGADPRDQNDQNQSAIELARSERDIRLAAIRAAQQAAPGMPADESEKILASLLQQLYDQEAILRLLGDAA